MLARSITKKLELALKISPVILLSGARQIGKSTLSLSLFKNYLTFDDGELKLQAKENPKGFLRMIDKPICLDEIQKAPLLLEYIKINVDQNRTNGDFLLTGSANILDNKEVKDTLAGRIIELVLYPLSVKEKNKRENDNIVDNLFKHEFRVDTYDYYDQLIQHILSGGYPEMLKLQAGMEKSLWFSSYISTYIERDARDLGEIRDIDSFIKFVNVLSTRSACILNKSNLSTQIGITNKTTKNYLAILQRIYQGFLVKPYFESIGKQFIKSPKFYLGDTGLLTHFVKIETKKELLNSHYCGAVFETFVMTELQKHLSYSHHEYDLYHYRTNDAKEIDFQNNSKQDIIGIIFYTGDRTIELSDKLVAIPMSFFL
ncbi:ATP-binding protein [sulfur-oxidizing endosymbiont of Gigantopelta aegis]|uniref:ATP-binding protein n=1 Tax=sulfur-oxidizing endosymbiont of Gigantopelta aegis TaxID=2794934 RepID=UPI0018DC2BB0|nr:ATP-binding protein [sulfur-oxidizing endosymbiont of Gigantopelta aegis]